MFARDKGLTKIAKDFRGQRIKAGPEIQRLRELHHDMDQTAFRADARIARRRRRSAQTNVVRFAQRRGTAIAAPRVIAKTVMESGLLRDAGDHYVLNGTLPPLAIPSTLHDSLMARLDRLASVKEVAQIGAVIGREFSQKLLTAVAPVSEGQVVSALDQLVQSELIFRLGVPPEVSYSFRHALVRDTAYESLLRSRLSVAG